MFAAGKRQLIALARAYLSPARLIVTRAWPRSARPGLQRPPLRFAGIRDIRNRLATSRSLAPLGQLRGRQPHLFPAAPILRSKPPSGYPMTLTYRAPHPATRACSLRN
jgi:hypothetical protein